MACPTARSWGSRYMRDGFADGRDALASATPSSARHISSSCTLCDIAGSEAGDGPDRDRDGLRRDSVPRDR